MAIATLNRRLTKIVVKPGSPLDKLIKEVDWLSMKEITGDKMSGKRKKSRIICVLDKSGSMISLRQSVVSGFNEFISGVKGSGDDAKVTLALFDTEYRTVYEKEPIEKVRALTQEDYVPGGMTALNDAVAKTINDHKGKSKRKTIFVIMTDGYENASQEFIDRGVIKNMVKERQDAGWEFVFLGANVDAFAEAATFGISRGSTMTYDPTDSGVVKASRGMAVAYAASMSEGGIGDNFDLTELLDEDEEQG